MSDLASNVLQENILTLAAFSDEHAPIIRGSVEPALFGGLYREIVVRIYTYIDKHKKAPGEHIADILDDKLNSERKQEARLYDDIITSMHQIKDDLNPDYVLSQLESFVKRQNLRSVAVDLAKQLSLDTPESLEKADELIRSVQSINLNVFQPGIRLSDPKQALRFFDETAEAFPTGIPELDKFGFGPTRGELYMAIAGTKMGKSWLLTHLGKVAIIHQLKVSHVTLEMSDIKVSQRYMQSLFGLAKRKETYYRTKFITDKLGKIKSFDEIRIEPRIALEDPKARSQLEKKIKRFHKKILDKIIIKQFPTGQLTINQLNAYLDNLEVSERFSPDIIIVDYPDIMKLDPANVRFELDRIYTGLRGIAVERNAAMVVVSQSHRASAKSRKVGLENIAEAWSKNYHADCILTYSQTEQERALGLARLFVAGGRNDIDQLTIAISQNYATGQYALSSALMDKDAYWDYVGKDEDEG